MIAHRLLETERGSDAAIIFLGQFCSGDLFGGDCCSWYFSKKRAHVLPLPQGNVGQGFTPHIITIAVGEAMLVKVLLHILLL